MKKEEKYYGTNWTPEGWEKQEWQEIWRKLWLLSRTEVKMLAKKLGTYFLNKEIQKKASKSDFIELIDDGVDKKQLIAELNKLIAKRDKIIQQKNQDKWTYKEFTNFIKNQLNYIPFDQLIVLLRKCVKNFPINKELNQQDIYNILECYSKKGKLIKEIDKIIKRKKESVI